MSLFEQLLKVKHEPLDSEIVLSRIMKCMNKIGKICRSDVEDMSMYFGCEGFRYDNYVDYNVKGYITNGRYIVRMEFREFYYIHPDGVEDGEFKDVNIVCYRYSDDNLKLIKTLIDGVADTTGIPPDNVIPSDGITFASPLPRSVKSARSIH